MTYELAKQLKDAGFPQKGKGAWEWVERVGVDVTGPFYFPTLPELIEACPKTRQEKGEEYPGYLSLSATDNGWKAGYDRFYPYEGNMFDMDTESLGSTPKEAVANLWLALNGKT